jgi:endonuclease/exonuclease/phosphatase family metal-dependent hydrolase
MADIYILSSIGVLGILYGLSNLSYNKPNISIQNNPKRNSTNNNPKRNSTNNKLQSNPLENNSPKNIHKRNSTNNKLQSKGPKNNKLESNPLENNSPKNIPKRNSPKNIPKRNSTKNIPKKSNINSTPKLPPNLVQNSPKLFEDKCLFWNLNYKSFNTKSKEDILIQQINKYNPDIMVLVEAEHLVPTTENNSRVAKIKLPNYKKNQINYSEKEKNGIIIYWKDYDIIQKTDGYSIFNTGIKKSYGRPCIGVKLKKDKKIINIIGVHLGHNIGEKVLIESLQKLIDELDIKSGEDLIIGGDFNEFYTKNISSLTFNQMEIGLKSNNINTVTVDKDYPADLIYSNLNFNSVTTTDKRIVSDHKPLLINYLRYKNKSI